MRFRPWTFASVLSGLFVLGFSASGCVSDNNNGGTDGGLDASADTTTPDARPDVTVDANDAGETSAPAKVTAVAAGGSHACVVFSDGHVDCWGDNTFGELGVPTAQNGTCTDGTNTWGCQPPVRVPGITNATAIAAGMGFTCALDAQGKVWCWGRNDVGQLAHTVGQGDAQCTGPSAAVVACNPTPTQVSNAANVVQITAGYNHACLRTQTNTVRCWGDNSQGELGDGTTAAYSAALVAPSGLPPVADISAGMNLDTCAVEVAGGQAWCWGFDDWDQLGEGTPAGGGGSACISFCAGTPQKAQDASKNLYVGGTRAWLGHTYSCMELASGGTKCWGYPQGIAVGANTPLAADAGATGFTTRWETDCATLGNGSRTCWGANTFGEIGDGTLTNNPTPATFTTPANTTQLSAGPNFFVALDAAGTVYAWGSNAQGQLGHAQSQDQTCSGGAPCKPTPTALPTALP